MSKKLTLQQMETILACVKAATQYIARNQLGEMSYPSQLERQLQIAGLGSINWNALPELRAWIDIGYELAIPGSCVKPNLSAFSTRVRNTYDALTALANTIRIGELHSMLMQEMINEKLKIPESAAAPSVELNVDFEMGT